MSKKKRKQNPNTDSKMNTSTNNNSSTKTPEQTKPTVAPVQKWKLVLVSIAVIAIFGGILAISLQYLGKINMEKKEDIYNIPDYSALVNLGEYHNLSYTLDEFDNEHYSTHRDQIVDNILSQVMQTTTFSGYSEAEYNDAYAVADNNVNNYANVYGLSKEDFLRQYYGFQSIEEYEAYMRSTTITYLQVRMVLMQIAYSEHLTIDEADIARVKEDLKTQYNLTDEELNQMYTNTDFQFYAVRDAVYDWIMTNENIVDNVPEPTETPTPEPTPNVEVNVITE